MIGHLATGHFFADGHLATIAPDFAAKAALRVVFFVFELCSKTKNTLFSGGFSRPVPPKL